VSWADTRMVRPQPPHRYVSMLFWVNHCKKRFRGIASSFLSATPLALLKPSVNTALSAFKDVKLSPVIRNRNENILKFARVASMRRVAVDNIRTESGGLRGDETVP